MIYKEIANWIWSLLLRVKFRPWGKRTWSLIADSRKRNGGGPRRGTIGSPNGTDQQGRASWSSSEAIAHADERRKATRRNVASFPGALDVNVSPDRSCLAGPRVLVFRKSGAPENWGPWSIDRSDRAHRRAWHVVHTVYRVQNRNWWFCNSGSLVLGPVFGPIGPG
jgi:hypothetical protein